MAFRMFGDNRDEVVEGWIELQRNFVCMFS